VEAPDAAFDRQWALTVLARALATLEAELRDSGKGLQFDTLKPWLTADGDATPQSEAAAKLGLSEEADQSRHPPPAQTLPRCGEGRDRSNRERFGQRAR
jgi:hypothetical protein